MTEVHWRATVAACRTLPVSSTMRLVLLHLSMLATDPRRVEATLPEIARDTGVRAGTISRALYDLARAHDVEVRVALSATGGRDGGPLFAIPGSPYRFDLTALWVRTGIEIPTTPAMSPAATAAAGSGSPIPRARPPEPLAEVIPLPRTPAPACDTPDRVAPFDIPAGTVPGPQFARATVFAADVRLPTIAADGRNQFRKVGNRSDLAGVMVRTGSDKTAGKVGTTSVKVGTVSAQKTPPFQGGLQRAAPDAAAAGTTRPAPAAQADPDGPNTSSGSGSVRAVGGNSAAEAAVTRADPGWNPGSARRPGRRVLVLDIDAADLEGRCRQHSHLPGLDRSPPCTRCGDVRAEGIAQLRALLKAPRVRGRGKRGRGPVPGQRPLVNPHRGGRAAGGDQVESASTSGRSAPLADPAAPRAAPDEVAATYAQGKAAALAALAAARQGRDQRDARRIGAAAEAIRCPDCHADPGATCHDRHGRELERFPAHARRLRDAARRED